MDTYIIDVYNDTNLEQAKHYIEAKLHDLLGYYPVMEVKHYNPSFKTLWVRVDDLTEELELKIDKLLYVKVPRKFKLKSV